MNIFDKWYLCFQIDVTWFYSNCLTDTCGCNQGGDCECFCTSVSAYAHQCCQHGVAVDWRSPRVCRKFTSLALPVAAAVCIHETQTWKIKIKLPGAMNWITKPQWQEDEWLPLIALHVNFGRVCASFHICGPCSSIFNSLSCDVKGKVVEVCIKIRHASLKPKLQS